MSATNASLLANESPVFQGFPYLVTSIVPSLHHILLLPPAWDIERLIAFAQKQVRANKLPTCLVLAGNQCIHLNEDGSGFRSSNIPCRSDIVSEKLAPTEPVPESEEPAIRRMELILREESQFSEQKQQPSSWAI